MERAPLRLVDGRVLSQNRSCAGMERVSRFPDVQLSSDYVVVVAFGFMFVRGIWLVLHHCWRVGLVLGGSMGVTFGRWVLWVFPCRR